MKPSRKAANRRQCHLPHGNFTPPSNAIPPGPQGSCRQHMRATSYGDLGETNKILKGPPGSPVAFVFFIHFTPPPTDRHSDRKKRNRSLAIYPYSLSGVAAQSLRFAERPFRVLGDCCWTKGHILGLHPLLWGNKQRFRRTFSEHP